MIMRTHKTASEQHKCAQAYVNPVQPYLPSTTRICNWPITVLKPAVHHVFGLQKIKSMPHAGVCTVCQADRDNSLAAVLLHSLPPVPVELPGSG